MSTEPPPAKKAPIETRSEAETEGIRIVVESEYLESKSLPRASRYVFTYTVRILNRSKRQVQLMTREWIIQSADGSEQVVRGRGVVGKQPVLPPGARFEYTSFCPLTCTHGSMRGHYVFKVDGDERFNATVGEFALMKPFALN